MAGGGVVTLKSIFQVFFGCVLRGVSNWGGWVTHGLKRRVRALGWKDN